MCYNLRVSQSMLDAAIKRLNESSKCRYIPNDCYGYAQLAVQMPNSSGISNMSLGNTKSELYYQIQFLLDWISKEHNKEYHVKSCKHFDDFNMRDEFRDRGLIHEYKGKYVCISCTASKFTINEFNLNHKNMNALGEVKK